MTGSRPIHRVTATPAARQAIAGLRARGGPLMFVQSAGCCGGSAPMCFRRGEFLLGAADVLLGEVEGCPFYIDRQLDCAWAGQGCCWTWSRASRKVSPCRPGQVSTSWSGPCRAGLPEGGSS